MTVTEQEIRDALRSLDLSRRDVCVHSSLRSFGRVEGGARAVVGAFLEEGCTVLVPTFSSVFEIERANSAMRHANDIAPLLDVAVGERDQRPRCIR